MKTKQIQGFSNYTISTTGVVTRIKARHPRWGTISSKAKVMALSSNNKGYLTLGLTTLEGYSKNFKVHRLVAQAFIPNPGNKPQVNHIDGDKRNNNVANLEWCTNSENQLHAYATGLQSNNKGANNPMFGKQGYYKGKRGNAHSKSVPVLQLSLDYTIIAKFESGILAADAVGGNSSNIMKACKGLIKKSAGFHWCFPEDYKYLLIDSLYKEQS